MNGPADPRKHAQWCSFCKAPASFTVACVPLIGLCPYHMHQFRLRMVETGYAEQNQAGWIEAEAVLRAMLSEYRMEQPS